MRTIGDVPGFSLFKPAGIPSSRLEWVSLTLDEVEAIRLTDLEGLYQEVAAERMQVSRRTFGRILESAHRKIAQALVQGKALKIEGGNIAMNELHAYGCAACGHQWVVPCAQDEPQVCPNCGSSEFQRTNRCCAGGHGHGAGHGRHRRGRCCTR